MTYDKTIAVLIPCYNECHTIGKTVKDFQKALPTARIYVYDNNSTDGSDEIARNAGATIVYEHNQGKGNVVRSMFKQIDADCYVMVDGDDTYPAENAKEMCDLILNHGIDMVIGDRISSNYSDINKRRFHNFGNILVQKLVNWIFNSNLKDIMTGYRAFSKSFVKICPVLSKGFEIETEITTFALNHSFQIKEVPIVYRDRPKNSFSKLNTFKDGTLVLITLAKLFRDYKPYTFFSLLALFFVLIATVLIIPIISEYIHSGLVPRFPTLITSVAFSLIGVLFYFCGIILDVIQNKNKQLFELIIKRNLLIL